MTPERSKIRVPLLIAGAAYVVLCGPFWLGRAVLRCFGVRL